MKKLFLKRKQKKEQKASLKRLSDLQRVFGTLQRLEQADMLSFDVKNRRLFLEQPLAMLMMSTAENWTAFLQNVFMWLYYRQCQEAWDGFILREELQAVKRAREHYALLTRADIERVKRQRRDEIAEGDIEPPRIEPFEFYIIREVAPTDDDKQQKPSGEVMVVGWYDGQSEELEMASWDEVKRFLNTEDRK